MQIPFWKSLTASAVLAASASSALGQTAMPTLDGIKFGVGLALTFPFDRERGGISEAEVDGTGTVRVSKESTRTPLITLESHYFFPARRGASSHWFCQSDTWCSHGPFVAIQAGGESNNAISAYALGWMLGFKRNDDVNDSSSWNIGLGYVVRTGVRVLGDGLRKNQPLPTGDTIRYKEISQPGWMWLTSFSF